MSHIVTRFLVARFLRGIGLRIPRKMNFNSREALYMCERISGGNPGFCDSLEIPYELDIHCKFFLT